jgi:N-methylhydantoinase A
MLVAPRGVERVRSHRSVVEQLDWDQAEGIIRELEAAGRSVLREAQVVDEDVQLGIALDMRYVGQAHELTIEVPARAFSARAAAPLRTAFETEYLRRYGLTLEGMPVEIVSWRVSVQGPPILSLAKSDGPRGTRSGAQTGSRRAHFRECGGFTDTPVHPRIGLVPGARIAGPALLEEDNTTIVVAPGWTAWADEDGNVLMKADA